MAELLVRRSGSRALGPYRLVRAGGRALGGGGLASAGSGGGGGAPAAVGGAALLTDEADGFAADFLYATDAKRVAVKASSTTTEYGVDAFFANAGTSPKQVTDVAGTLVWSPHNMVLRSEEFDNASWAKNNSTVTANAIADHTGAMTADKLIETAVTNIHTLSQTVTTITGATYTFTVCAKAGERTWAFINFYDGTDRRTFFDLANGVVGTTGAGVTPAMTSLGDGWYRLSATLTVAATSCTVQFALSSNGVAFSYAGDGVSGAYFARAQLNRGSVPTAYLSTTTAARYGLALDYDPVTHAAKGLLCEPAATNLLLRSGEFDHASWGKTNSTVTANAVAGPNGALEADAFIPGVAASVQYLQQNVTTVAATAYTFSVYVKNGALGNNWIDLTISSTTTWRVWFNLATGAKGTSLASPTSYNITSVGSGWYRLDVTVTAGTTTTQCFMLARSSDGSTSFVTGDAVTPAFYVWGAQLETGTVATSPIPTYAATATRAQDVYNVTPASINYSATAGSWWVENYQTAFVGSGPRIIGFSGSITPLYFSSASAISLFDTGSLTKTMTTLSGSVRKWASAFASGDRAITADGLAPVTDAGSVATLLNPGVTLQFGNGATSNPMLGYIRKVYYLPRRMSNAELQTKTTP